MKSNYDSHDALYDRNGSDESNWYDWSNDDWSNDDGSNESNWYDCNTKQIKN